MSRWTRVSGEHGQPDYYLITNTDVTEQRKNEIHLLRAQRMESIGTLAGGIAHDLNNVLSPVLMSVDMLQLNEPNPDDEKWLKMIRESAERGAELVKQVLTFARGLGGEKVSVQLRHIVKELIGVLVETLPKNIVLKFDVSTDLLPISADPTQMQQVLMNLCINARDAMPEGGTLQIKVENSDVDAQVANFYPGAVPGRYIKIDIDDTGIGRRATYWTDLRSVLYNKRCRKGQVSSFHNIDDHQKPRRIHQRIQRAGKRFAVLGLPAGCRVGSEPYFEARGT